MTIAEDDPLASDVQELLRSHLAFANEHSPPEDVHALDIEGLLDPGIRSSVRAVMNGVSGIIQSSRGGEPDDSCNCQDNANSGSSMNPMMMMIIAEKLKK